jgi:hypothetical protein
MVAAAAFAACREPAPAPPPRMTTVTRPAVSWQGTGNRTLDFVSESGTFRISWATHGEQPKGSGTFTLTVHSGVSGRPLRQIAVQRGEGNGSTLFEDDPRPYHLMIEAAHLEWSVSVEELVTVPSEPPKD